jgi:dienelactone hydrolase
LNAEPSVGHLTTPSPIESRYFDSGPHRLFGWYHPPGGGRTRAIGVVVCNPFGYESICGHRSVRAFAESIASLGIPVLRFDYAGTGDSADHAAGADQLAIWTRDIIAAVAELQRISGVRQVCLLGIRIGGLLAALASRQCPAIAGLALVAPIVNGRRYVRELRTLRLAATMGSTGPGSSTKSATDSAPMEVSGFQYSAATIAALSQVDLNPQSISRSTRMLIVDGTAMPAARAWANELSALDAEVTYKALPGLVEMLMTAPHFAAAPAEMIAAVVEWLDAPICGWVDSPEGAPPGSDPAPASIMEFETFTERPIFLPSDTLLFAITAEPKAGREIKGAIVLINAGADYHIGASGMNVALSRRWATDGYVALRMDLAGIGDSGTREGCATDEVFPPRALDDIRAAIRWLRSRYGVEEITLVGLCSGAYHTLRATLEGIGVERALMINPETFFWKEGMSIYARQTAELVNRPGEYRGKLASLATWKRLVTGQVDVAYILGTMAGRISLLAGARWREIARRLRLPLAGDLGSQLEAAVARGARMIFVFSRGEPGIELLRLQAGSSLERFPNQLRVHIVDDADHVFSRLSSRETLEAILSGELRTPN